MSEALCKTGVGVILGFPGISGMGEPNGEARGKRPVGSLSERTRGVSGKIGEPRAGTGGKDKLRKKVLPF